MKNLLLIRHGDYEGFDLTVRGRDQMSLIANEIKKITGKNQDQLYLLSSTASRAEQSAEIIADKLGLKNFDKNEELRIEKGYVSEENIKSIDKLISKYFDKAAIIVVSHLPLILPYANHVTKKINGRDDNVGYVGVAEGINIDLESRIFEKIPRRFEKMPTRNFKSKYNTSITK
jgi:phosphohistidine phosphatase SixA